MKDALQKLKSGWWKIAAGVVAIVVVVFAIDWKIEADRHLLLSKTAQQFDSDPLAWIGNPQDYSRFRAQLLDGRISAVGVSYPLVVYTTSNGEKHSTRLPCGWGSNCDAMREVNEVGVKNSVPVAALAIDPRPLLERSIDTAKTCLANSLLICFQGMMIFFGLSYWRGRTQDAQVLKDVPVMRFKDVIGVAEAKQSLGSVTKYLNDPEKYIKVGARAPKGVLMVGPPGTGKTLLAQALAGECGAKFIPIDGSYFTSKFFGSGVEKVKSVFDMARKNAPCLVFIDEIDGIGLRRAGDGGGAQEENRIINRILVEMDGFSKTEGVIVIAATNNVESLDPAMRRAGRFDFVVHVQMPNQVERKELFDLYLTKVNAVPGIDTRALARMGMGLSPADIANLVNKAAAAAADAGHDAVTEELLMLGLESHQLGGAVSSVKVGLTMATRKRVAVHEAGHGLVSYVLGAGNVDRISIEPRASSLGATYVSRPNEDPLMGGAEIHSNLAGLLAGRQAELLVLGEASTGAADDLKRATAKAYQMVGELGLGHEFGPLSVEGLPAKLIGNFVERQLITDVRMVLSEAEQQCQRVLVQHRQVLDELIEQLVQEETLSGIELQAILKRADESVPTLATAA